MGDVYKEVCWYDKILKEASQLLSLRHLSDMWEQNQDTSNTEISRDSTEIDFKSQNITSTENQNSLLKTTNAISHHMENINVCMPSFHTGQCIKNAEESLNLFGESPKRRSGDTSVENSSKRMNFDSTCESKSSVSPTKINVECAMTSLENRFHVASMSRKNFTEECQVVPVTLSLSSEAIINENTLSYKSLDNCEKSNNYDNTVMTNAAESDKLTPKPRQVSVDSMLDSGMGDSCNSIDSTEEKFDIAELKNRSLERHCWQPKIRESLAIRLPGMLFSQIVKHSK